MPTLIPGTSAEAEPVGGDTEYGWCLDSVAPKLHTERITSMVWIKNMLVSGDKVIVVKQCILQLWSVCSFAELKKINVLLSSFLEYMSDNAVWRD